MGQLKLNRWKSLVLGRESALRTLYCVLGSLYSSSHSHESLKRPWKMTVGSGDGGGGANRSSYYSLVSSGLQCLHGRHIISSHPYNHVGDRSYSPSVTNQELGIQQLIRGKARTATQVCVTTKRQSSTASQGMQMPSLALHVSTNQFPWVRL